MYLSILYLGGENIIQSPKEILLFMSLKDLQLLHQGKYFRGT